MDSVPKAFYAYASKPAHIGESIEAAIATVNNSDLVNFASWRQLRISGSPVINQITRAIDTSDIFAADLSTINFNVIFELGYAIGKERRLWLSASGITHTSETPASKIDVLLPMGYSSFVNSHQLSTNLFRDAPWDNLQSTLPLHRRVSGLGTQPSPTLLYLQSPVMTDASIALTQELDATTLFRSHIVDNPSEVPMESLNWYIQKVLASSAVVVHLLPNADGSYDFHNAKCSLVSGLAHALDKPLCMIAHSPFNTPLDYQHILKYHDTAQQCKVIAKRWLDDIGDLIDLPDTNLHISSNKHTKAIALSEISVGELVAEHESSTIDSYFVETGAFRHALEGRQTIFVGRKGTGKSANFLAVASRLQQDNKNHVCIVKPVAYELPGIVQLIKTASDKAERGYLVESVWKFLLLTELANSVTNEISSRPKHYLPTQGEIDLIKFLDDNDTVFSASFTVRLQSAVERIVNEDVTTNGPVARRRVSELLHDQVISKLRSLLGEALRDRERVAILVDNLDTGWGDRDDTSALSHFILGLLEVAPVIEDYFRSGNRRNPSVNVSLAVFLRSDIFSVVQDVASEPDKTAYDRITWNDKELLLRVIDSRLRHSTYEKLTAEQIWHNYFVSEVNGVDPREFIANNVLARPRDAIYLVREMLSHAVNHGHSKVSQEDMIHALNEYSQFALQAVIVEDDPRSGKLESILYEFAGSPDVVPRTDVFKHFRNAGVEEDAFEHYLNLLLDINFLGLPNNATGMPEFPTDESVRRIKQRVVNQIANKKGIESSYHIHRVIWPVLEIAPNSGISTT